MDTFDSISLGVFVLIYSLLVARMTFWKRQAKDKQAQKAGRRYY